jgi:gamma-glutamyl:cysteine ligase YbdK (ATP-grasp superfamily)
LTASQTQNAILQQSNSICQGLNQLGNTVMAGSTNNLLATKDLSTQVAQGNAIILQAIAQNEAQALRDKLMTLDASNRALGTEVNVTQNVNQMQQQAQQQAQLQGISSLLAGVVPLIYQRATNDQINIGSGTMSGNSASNANTAIR